MLFISVFIAYKRRFTRQTGFHGITTRKKINYTISRMQIKILTLRGKRRKICISDEGLHTEQRNKPIRTLLLEYLKTSPTCERLSQFVLHATFFFLK